MIPKHYVRFYEIRQNYKQSIRFMRYIPYNIFFCYFIYLYKNLDKPWRTGADRTMGGLQCTYSVQLR
jgi:hypothetical protein